jgi:hypothetical protein
MAAMQASKLRLSCGPAILGQAWVRNHRLPVGRLAALPSLTPA